MSVSVGVYMVNNEVQVVVDEDMHPFDAVTALLELRHAINKELERRMTGVKTRDRSLSETVSTRNNSEAPKLAA